MVAVTIVSVAVEHDVYMELCQYVVYMCGKATYSRHCENLITGNGCTHDARITGVIRCRCPADRPGQRLNTLSDGLSNYKPLASQYIKLSSIIYLWSRPDKSP